MIVFQALLCGPFGYRNDGGGLNAFGPAEFRGNLVQGPPCHSPEVILGGISTGGAVILAL